MTAVAASTLLADLAEDFFVTRRDLNPLFSSVMGVEDAPTVELHDVSVEGEARARGLYADLLSRAEAIPTEGLTTTELTSLSMMRTLLEQGIEAIDTRVVEMQLDAFFGGPQAQMLVALPKTPIKNVQDAEDYLERLARLPKFFDDTLDRLRAGAARGLTATRMGAQAAIDQCRGYAAAPDEGNAFLIPLVQAEAAGVELPADIAARASKALADIVRPTFLTFADAVEAELLATGRPDEQAGLCHLAEGPGLYLAALKEFTTTDTPPDEIHKLGLEIIEKLAAEYAEIGLRVFGTDDLPTIFSKLRDDPALRYADPAEAVADAQRCVDKAQAIIGDWIGRLPSKPCVVTPIPEAAAKGMTVAYYQPPQGEDAPSGTYWINTTGPIVTRYEAEAVAYHEAIPGHHLQIALQGELDLPRFRQVGLVLSGYMEGWGLYTERLADEMGLYSSDVARLGMVATDSLRACRLVVDTGIHHLGWTRQQAIDYMLANSPLSEEFIVAEVNRYIVYAGQACAYMIGRIEIQRLRALAEDELGDAFDLRAFHDVVLGEGAVPLSVLAENVERWIGQAKAPAA